MSLQWTADSTFVTADSIGFTADGGYNLTMPNVIGMEFATAQTVLQQFGVYNPFFLSSLVSPITAKWQRSSLPPSTIIAQSPASGTAILLNSPITLTMAEYPFGVAAP